MLRSSEFFHCCEQCNDSILSIGLWASSFRWTPEKRMTSLPKGQIYFYYVISSMNSISEEFLKRPAKYSELCFYQTNKYKKGKLKILL